VNIRSNHSRVFEEMLAAHRQTIFEALAAGAPADYPMYRQMVGRLEGLSDALEISKAAESKINGVTSDDR
jgi:hypothetical protein